MIMLLILISCNFYLVLHTFLLDYNFYCPTEEFIHYSAWYFCSPRQISILSMNKCLIYTIQFNPFLIVMNFPNGIFQSYI
jgi:hypothetical protein